MLKRTLMTFVKWHVFLCCVLACSLSNAKSAQMPTSIDDLEGRWYGFYHCRNINYEVEIDIDGGTPAAIKAQMEAEVELIYDGDLPYAKDFETKLAGSYDPALGVLQLSTLNQSNERTFQFTVVFDPQQERFAGTVNSSALRTCSYMVMGRSEIKKAIKFIAKHAEFENKAYQIRDEKCHKHVRKWLSQLDRLTMPLPPERAAYAAMDLYLDANFEPYYDDKFVDLSSSEIAELKWQITRNCVPQTGNSYRLQQYYGYLKQILENRTELPRANLLVYPVARDIVHNWKQAIKTYMAEQDTLPANFESLRQPLRGITTVLWQETPGLDMEFMQAQQRIQMKALYTQLRNQIDNAGTDFKSLAAVSSVLYTAQQGGSGYLYGESANDLDARLKKILQQHAVSSAENMVQNVTTPAGVQSELIPLEHSATYTALNAYVSAQQRDEINAVFARRRQQLLEQFAQAETQQLNAQAAQPASLQLLATLVSDYRRLQNEYGSLAQAPAFTPVLTAHNELRQLVLTKSVSKITERIAQAASASEISDIRGQYMLPQDQALPAATAIADASEKCLAIIAPFSHFAGGDYLNAIYQGDFAAMRRMDQEYLAGLKPLIHATSEYSKPMLKLMQGLSGGMIPGDALIERMEHEIDNASIVNPVLATYLFNYQELYSACLRSDAVTFTVTTSTPDVVTRNGLGWEVSRTYGSTSKTSYIVNREFQDAFYKIGTSEPNSGASRLVEGYFNQGRISELLDGTRAMMRTVPCGNAQIKQFEKNILTLFSQVN